MVVTQSFFFKIENLLELSARFRVYRPKKTDGEFEWSEAIQNYKTPKVGNNSANKKFADGSKVSEALSSLSPFRARYEDPYFTWKKIKEAGLD